MEATAYKYASPRVHHTSKAPTGTVSRSKPSKPKAKTVMQNIGMILAGALLLALVISVIASQAQITALSGEIAAVRKELSTAQSTYDYLSSSMDGITNRTNVQDMAEGKLGLVKADPSQMTYIRLEDESVIEKSTTGAAKLLESLRTAALNLISSFDP